MSYLYYEIHNRPKEERGNKKQNLPTTKSIFFFMLKKLKGGTRIKMMQLQKIQAKEISQKQADAINQIIQSGDFNLAEYRKLKKILDSRVITRYDASVFLEYCYTKVYFERYFNGHHHKAYAYCCFCKGRDNLRKIEDIKTGKRNWCCQTCRSNITDADIIDLPTAAGRKAEFANNGNSEIQASNYDTGEQIAKSGQSVDYLVEAGIGK